MMKCSVIKVPARSPNDMSALQRHIDESLINPKEVVAVLGKTEGNGCVNDFTRGFAVLALKNLFAPYKEASAEPVSFVMSGGTEGILSPHFSVITRSESDSIRSKQELSSLAIGVARTPDFMPEELGRLAQVDQVAEAVLRAMDGAGINDAADVHFVQIKCPLLTAEQVQEAVLRDASTVTEDTYKSMGYSRGASALGAAVALGEIERERLQDTDICHSWELFSHVASTSAGSELAYCEVIVFGNSAYAEGPYFIDHDVMKDAIDAGALKRILEKYPDAEMVQVLAKAEADPTGNIRGKRHTMLDDSDINHTRHARAVVGGVLASVCGDPMIYVSGGAEHQGPAGGGPVAVVFRRNEHK
ncbi:ring-opening amidohydrolase [Paenibacillus sp. ATY16]|uniref:cyanuric acid amidohydrolase n=1 Tax=Paenibacillus sp. ATY16 TaxID=1759312 RepID=UPI00200BA7CF|nr:ring-opening amidohydrolase [Paenibacillus sp. ATY16]MCK9860215.1 ring-opening amidohydrolase [Paenibacillus sp. ATY16]